MGATILRGSSGPGHVHRDDDHVHDDADASALSERVAISAEVDAFEREPDATAEAPENPTAIAPATPPRAAAPIERAIVATTVAGDPDTTLLRLTTLYQITRATRDRARVALKLAELSFTHDATSARAELFFIRARALDPSLDVRAMELKILLAQSRSAEALTLVDSMRRKDPDNLALRATHVRLLRDTGDRPGMLREAKLLLDAATVAGEGDGDLAEERMLLANAFYENKQRDNAVAMSNDVLRSGAAASFEEDAYRLLAMLLPAPAFASEPKEGPSDRLGLRAAEINALFEQGNVAYREGRYAKTLEIANALLRIAPDDGLAHSMWVAARNMERVSARPLIAPLDSEAERARLVAQLVEICATARVDGRPGRVDDLFPQWAELNELQQAQAALSVLAYGRLIPRVMAAGARYHIAGVGTSGAFLDPRRGPSKENEFGRTYYGIRGWFDPATDFIVTGVERLDTGLRNGSSVVSHEFAHLVLAVMRRAAAIPVEERTPEDAHLAMIAQRVSALYAETKAGRAAFYDAYSSNNEQEFFAQAMQAYLQPGNASARRLFSAQRELWLVADEVMKTYASYGASGGLSPQPAVGQDAIASPYSLQSLATDDDADVGLRELARATLQHLEALYMIAVLATPQTPRPPAGVVYNRASDLRQRIDAGDFEGAVEVARDISGDIEASVLSCQALDEANAALLFALDSAAEGARWKAWQVFLSIISFGIAAIPFALGKRDDRMARDALNARAKVRALTPLGMIEAHPDLSSLDVADVEQRKRLLLRRAEDLLRMRAGALPLGEVRERAAHVRIMGVDELIAQIELDRRANTEATAPLRRELATLSRDLCAGRLTSTVARQRLDALRTRYLELSL